MRIYKTTNLVTIKNKQHEQRKSNDNTIIKTEVSLIIISNTS